MSQSVTNCYKFTAKAIHQLYVLLCTAGFSIVWVLAVTNPSIAQVRSNQQREVLPVPRLPALSRQSVVPPPPGLIDVINPDAANVNRSSITVQHSESDDIKELENAFIGGRTPKKAIAKKRFQPRSLVALGGDIGIGIQQTNPSALTFNQLLNAPVANAQTVPTFNQLLNTPPQTEENAATTNQLFNTQTAALPPLPGTTPTMDNPVASQYPAPTFNQLLNAQAGTTQEFTAPGAPIYNQLPNFEYQTLPQSQNPVPPTATPIATPTPQRSLLSSRALREPSLILQGVYLTQGDDTSARARVTAAYPLTPQVLVGGTLDLTSEGSSFDDSRKEGLNINELYLATSLGGLPNLRFVIGQLDLTSYFDRNSFAKDGASQFFNPVFQTNPALAATGIASRPSLLVNWSVTDNIDAKAAVFSSGNRTSEFALDGFAGEVGVRYGNAIIRGTYASNRDAGNRDTFPESFSIARNRERTVFGPQEDDREEAYGLNAEVFIPNLKLGVFGRYGRYENRDLGEGADTYVLGASLLDLFTPDDRLGLAYGRALSNDRLRRGDQLDVLEMYYDFPFLSNLRLGFSVQGRDNFEETVLGVRVKSEFDVTPRGIAR
jgi:hypothetical protein